MSNRTRQPHIFFFPLMAHGHMISTIDLAKLFASRGCKASVILTPSNAALFADSIRRSRDLGLEIDIVHVKFPSEEVGFPLGCENINSIPSTIPDRSRKFYTATALLEHPVEDLLIEHRPDCLVADSLFPWATQVSARLGIPRLAFEGTNFFASCAETCLMEYEPHKGVSSVSEPFAIPTLPHEITFTRDQIPFYLKEESEFSCLARKVDESNSKGFGVIVNSFYELEPDYADHFRGFLGRKAWHIGPISLINSDKEAKAQRGPRSSIGEHECLNWLDSKAPNSVVYVSFGSVAKIKDTQLIEIAAGLEASGKPFIWVVRKEEKRDGVTEEWLPQGFEERIEGKGLIIRGWAPQVMILEHEAIGGFVTHCGWNSMLEGICEGLPMVTWPVSAEQFYNEKLVTQILGIGVGVGAEKWTRSEGDRVKREAVEKAVSRIMDGEEAAEMRKKARSFAEMARKAFEEGGSSYKDLDALIEELRMPK